MNNIQLVTVRDGTVYEIKNKSSLIIIGVLCAPHFYPDRREDIPLLFNYFIAKHADRYKCGLPQLSSSDIYELMVYSWPGNVRELNSIADRYIINLKGPKGPVSIKEILHSSGKYHPTLPKQVRAFERGLIVESLRKNKGVILGTPLKTLEYPAAPSTKKYVNTTLMQS